MPAEILSPTESNLARAAEALRAGEVVGMPTETVYGLAGNALDASAVSQIFAVKERPTFDPLIVHIAPEARTLVKLDALGLISLGELDAGSRLQAEKLIAAFWPGPLTLVLARGPRVPDLVTSGLPRVAIRMPRHPVAQALIRAAGVPLAAPSANRFGRISPTSAQDVVSELGDRIALVVDGGRCELGLESTVLALDAQGPVLLRPGGLPRAELERVLGQPVRLLDADSASKEAQLAPGMLASHYAPRKSLQLVAGRFADAIASLHLPRVIGFLAQRGEASLIERELAKASGREVRVEVLSPSGDLAEAARQLFASLRALDASDAELLFAEPCWTDEGLGHAIQDRLRRASVSPVISSRG